MCTQSYSFIVSVVNKVTSVGGRIENLIGSQSDSDGCVDTYTLRQKLDIQFQFMVKIGYKCIL